jgi:hypothetical protein
MCGGECVNVKLGVYVCEMVYVRQCESVCV